MALCQAGRGVWARGLGSLEPGSGQPGAGLTAGREVLLIQGTRQFELVRPTSTAAVGPQLSGGGGWGTRWQRYNLVCRGW